MSAVTYSGNTAFIFLYLAIFGTFLAGTAFFKKSKLAPEKYSRKISNAIKFFLYGSMIYGLSSGVVQIVKETTNRPRPYEIHQVRPTQALKNTTAGEERESFPSGHSAGAFMIVTILVRRFGKRMIAFYGWALLVAVSRVYLGAHFPSDVLIGGLIGGLMAMFVTAKIPKVFNLNSIEE
jgi:membrane-associated phospholipid phosphatase